MKIIPTRLSPCYPHCGYLAHITGKSILAVSLVGIGLVGCARLESGAHGGPLARAPHAPAVRVTIPSGTASALGVYEPQSPSSYNETQQFSQRIGRRVNLVLYFSGWNQGFQLQFASSIRAHGAIPIVQIDPAGVSLSAIAAGKYDSYLRSYAVSVRDYTAPVVIGFAHEPNGNWYSWGFDHDSPAVWVAAWRHVVNVFRSESARNVIWMWTMNVSSTSPYPLHAWWPGANYATWVGIDGYYASPSDTFSSLFGNSIAQIRQFTDDPILLSETAVGPATGHVNSDIANLFRGMHRHHLLGLVWFDSGGPQLRQDWRLEGHPAEMAAFRRAVRAYMQKTRG